jgi:hypothetical protein
MLIAFSLGWHIIWLSCWLFWVLMTVMEGVEVGKMYKGY